MVRISKKIVFFFRTEGSGSEKASGLGGGRRHISWPMSFLLGKSGGLEMMIQMEGACFCFFF